jgi:hypothetical protein
MAETLNSNLQQRRRETADDSENQPPSRICAICGNEEGYQDHFQPSPHYHAFAAPAQYAAATRN